jgi:hypothetical protein
MSYLDYAGLQRFKAKLDQLFAGKIDSSEKGVANGVATLGSSGKVPSSQLPTFPSDTRNTAGSSQLVATKMYLVGAQTQSSAGVTTYSNTKNYIGTDNWLYTNGKKVLTDAPSDLFILKRYTRTLGPAGSGENMELTANVIGISAVTGYMPIAVCAINVSPGYHELVSVDLSQISGSGYVVRYILNTHYVTSESLTLTMDILWAKTTAITDERT